MLIAVALAGGWYVDRRAARNGYRVSVHHSGLRREVVYTKIDEGDGSER